MQKLVNVEWFKKEERGRSLTELYQNTGMVFAFVTSPKNGGKACHEWVTCRDFLHDVIRSQITSRACSIYGFKYDPQKNPNADINKMRMLVSKHGLSKDEVGSFKAKMKASLALLNHFEVYAGVSLSTLKAVNPENSGEAAVFMFTGSSMWIKSPFLVSMYTFLIRLGDKKIKFKDAEDLKKKLKALHAIDLDDRDSKYLGDCWNKLHTIIKNRKMLFTPKNGALDIYHSSYSTNTFHNCGGIVSLSTSLTPDKKLNAKVKELTKK